MFQWWQKRRALRRIARRLPRDLVDRYGATDAYTASQVKDVLAERRYDRRYWNYALAMFVAAEYAAREVGGAGQVESMRGEIADRYFHGDPGFSLDTARSMGAGGALHDVGGPLGGGFGDGGGGGIGGDGGAGGGP